jgi:hypothetical protein
MNLPTKVIVMLLFFFMSIVQINHANNLTDTNEFINFTSKKETSVSFYDAYNANWKNIENHNVASSWNRMDSIP